MTHIMKAGTQVLARHNKDFDIIIIGTTTEDHDFSPGALSSLRIASSKLSIPDTFSIAINCNEWQVFELIRKTH